MAKLIQANSIAGAWSDLLSALLTEGRPVSPRGFGTREIMNVTLVVEEGLNNIFINSVRDLNYRFMVAEWLWIMGGYESVQLISKYNSVMSLYSDDGEILSGAYGPRLAPQWYYIYESLFKPGSRQAVATIWTPNPRDSKDIPCTISIQFFLRDELLHSTINMRSSDVWLGLPYDFFTFSQLTNMVGKVVGRRLGSVTFNLGSSHLYNTNFVDAAAASKVATINVESPSLTISGNRPTNSHIGHMLLQYEDLKLEWPWNEYANALKKDKKYALEVLRDIAPQ